MDAWWLLYRLLQAYVVALFVVGVGTAGWLVLPRMTGSPQVAGIWFAVGGFGLLVLVTLLVIEVASG